MIVKLLQLFASEVKVRGKSEAEKTRSTVNGIRKIVKKKTHKLKVDILAY